MVTKEIRASFEKVSALPLGLNPKIFSIADRSGQNSFSAIVVKR